MGGIAKEYFRF